MIDYALIASAVFFFGVSIYVLYNGDLLSALLSAGIGYLLLSLGVDLYKSRSKCR